ncbi:MAG: hypothetical protein JWR08_1919 [Enterovirga sp.]|nr:hypothetical protein [Enterovirga sp.]
MDRRSFTFGLLTATTLGGFGTRAAAQGAIPAMEYMVLASKGGMFLEETARSAFEKTQDPAVKRFARAEVVEQVNLSDKLAANSRMPAGAPGTPGGLVGAAVAAPFAIAGTAAAAAGTLFGLAPDQMTSDAQKAAIVSQIRAMPPGPAFDATFVQIQLQGHQEAYAIHSGYAQNGDDPALRRVARGALPLLRLHISQLTRMQRTMAPAG